MADLVNIKDFSGASVPVLTDDVTGSVFGAGQVQVFKQMDGTSGSTNVQVINAAGESRVVQNNQLSAGNSSTANLAGAAVFTGTSEDVSNYAEIRISVYSSHASATDGMSLQQSTDGTNWDIMDAYTISAATAKVLCVPVQALYFRIVYTNGATLTTTLRIQTVYHKIAGRGSSHRPQDGRTNDTDMEEMLAHQMVFNGTTWDRQQSSGGAANVRQPDATGAGSLTAAAQAVTVAINGTSSTAIQVTGTFVATLQFEGTVDGTNWVSLFSTPNGMSATVTSTTAPGVWLGKSGGFSQIRVRASAYTSGTAVVTIRAGQGTGNVGVDTSLRGTAATANPTAAANAAGTNIMTDKLGRLVTVNNHARDMTAVQATTITSLTTAQTIVTAGGVGVFRDLTNLQISNGSATATNVTISDGTIAVIYNVPAGGGLVIPFPTPRKATTANVAWTATCSVSVASIYIGADYVNNL